MNCKQGDLAIVISGLYVGQVVECVRFIGVPPGVSAPCADYWQIDRCLCPLHSGTISDSLLRPLRADDAGIDEMVRIAGPAPFLEPPTPSCRPRRSVRA